MKYTYIKIVHEGEDYITVRKGSTEYEITGNAMHIIDTLLDVVNRKVKINETNRLVCASCYWGGAYTEEELKCFSGLCPQCQGKMG